MQYSYCPKCGRKLVLKEAGDDGNIPFCENCNKFWFDTFATCIIVLIYNEFDEIVLCKQNYLSEKYRTLTAGYIKPGESAEETAFREVKEELGLNITNLTYVGSYWFAKNDMLMLGYVAYSAKREFILSKEVDSAEWVKSSEAPKTMIPDEPGNAIWKLYNYYLKEIKKI